MPDWTFLDYVDSQGRNPISIWLDSYQIKTRTQIKAKLVSSFQIANAIGRLTVPRFESLSGQHSDLIAIRFEKRRVAYRVIACYGIEVRKEVWLLAGGTEHNNHYRPPGILETALARRADILFGGGQVTATCLLESNN